ncbi:MAG: AAA family ATPase [Bacteroidota bacterium]
MDLVLDKRTKSIYVQKREDNIVYPISYNLIADTLQRIIFHYAAIESNKDSILLFEEPESHAFPPYITQLAHKIMEGENNNQYFITTHSPFLFNTIVENTNFEDLAVFIVSYQDYQTQLKKLSKTELSDLPNNGIDIFFNQAYFLNE